MTFRVHARSSPLNHRFVMACCLSTWASLPVHAQSSALEEVIVTAQKRAESLQDTSIAISTFGEESIENLGISDITDVGAFSPNVKIVNAPASTSAATISIRGSVTTNPNINWEPTVGTYVDGVFIGKTMGSVFDMVELTRVEVLRGPQGTLYGKNTIGGAVNFITRKPSGEFHGKLRTSVGNEDYRSAYLRLDSPTMKIGDGGLYGSVAVLRKKRDGFYKNRPDPFGNPLARPVSTDEFENISDKGVRADMVFDATESLTFEYAFDYYDQDSQPSAAQLINVDSSNALYPGAIGLESYLVDANDPASSISNDYPSFERSKTRGHTLDITYHLDQAGPFGSLDIKSISAYRTMDWADGLDLDGSPIFLYGSNRFIDYEQRSQEFQLAGQTSRLDYVFGLYYFDEKGDVFSPLSFFGVFGAPVAHNSYGIDNQSTAIYGQIDWRPGLDVLENRLTLTLGARWTEEKKDQYIVHPDANIVIPFTEADDTWTNFSPTFTATWALSEDVNIYGRVASGWKSGGFNSQARTQQSFLMSYKPEEVTSYELGLKSEWLDNRLRLNAAAFYNKEDDLQQSVFLSGNSFASVIRNAGKATIQGFEMELTALISNRVQLSATYGYLDAEYDEFIDGGIDVKNEREFPYTPQNTASLILDWDVWHTEYGRLDFHTDLSYSDEYVVEVEPRANGDIDDYYLVNVRLTLSEIPVKSGNMKVSLWSRNVTDEQYRVSEIDFGGWAVGFFGNPRTYGLDVAWEF